MSEIKWDLIDGIALARRLELLAIPMNCHIALGGGVLQRGYSKKDLDIFVYPRKASKKTLLPAEILRVFEATDIKQVNYHFDDGKTVFSCKIDGRRVDFFFVA